MMIGRSPFLLKIAPHSPNILRQQSQLPILKSMRVVMLDVIVPDAVFVCPLLTLIAPCLIFLPSHPIVAGEKTFQPHISPKEKRFDFHIPSACGFASTFFSSLAGGNTGCFAFH
jgi:hypothetical protein